MLIPLNLLRMRSPIGFSEKLVVSASFGDFHAKDMRIAMVLFQAIEARHKEETRLGNKKDVVLVKEQSVRKLASEMRLLKFDVNSEGTRVSPSEGEE